MGSFIAIILSAAMVGGFVHMGLAAIPAAQKLQDAAACRQQQALPGIETGRQLHCSQMLP